MKEAREQQERIDMIDTLVTEPGAKSRNTDDSAQEGELNII